MIKIHILHTSRTQKCRLIHYAIMAEIHDEPNETNASMFIPFLNDNIKVLTRWCPKSHQWHMFHSLYPPNYRFAQSFSRYLVQISQRL